MKKCFWLFKGCRYGESKFGFAELQTWIKSNIKIAYAVNG